MATAAAVAAVIRSRLTNDPGIMKVHKLLYYCQGWHYTWTGETLFGEAIEAWDMGPVVADLWRAEKYNPTMHPTPALGPVEERTVSYVMNRYGKLWGSQLSGKTHSEDPWRDARASYGTANAEITPQAMASFFSRDPAADQAWFWNADWQAGEAETDEDIRLGRTTVDLTTDDLLDSLRSIRADI